MNRNIDACKQLSMMTRSALGPHGKFVFPRSFLDFCKYGAFFLSDRKQSLLTLFLHIGMNKMVINYLEKLFITSDAATIIKETDVHHPAAKMIAQAAKMQENECGDGTNLLISMAGELMTQAQSLIQMGLHPSEILIGYEKAAKKSMELLDGIDSYTSENLRNQQELTRLIKGTVASKQFGLEDFLAGLISEAAIHAMPRDAKSFTVDNVRVQKVLGGGIHDS